MLGCLFGLIRWVLALTLLVAIGAAGYLYVRANPDKFRGGLEGAVEGVKGQAEDVALATRVKAAIGLRHALKDIDAGISAERGVVTLRGRVPSQGLKTEFVSVVAAVPGVIQIVDFVEVDSRVSPVGPQADPRTAGERIDDEALQLKVCAAFELDRELRAADITVTSMRRSVTLSSATATEVLLRRAESVARSVDGVKNVTILAKK